MPTATSTSSGRPSRRTSRSRSARSTGCGTVTSDLLGRCVHHEDRHQRHHVDADVAPRRAGRADADISVQRAHRSRSRSRSTGTTCRRRSPTGSRSTTRVRSAHRWCVTRASHVHLRGDRSVGGDPLVARPWVQLGGVAGAWSAVRSFTAQTPAAGAAHEHGHQPHDRGRGHSSSGTIVMSAGRPTAR